MPRRGFHVVLLAAALLAGCGTTGSGDPEGPPAPAVPVAPTVTATPDPSPAAAPPTAAEYRRAADRACARARREGERALARVADLRPEDPHAFQRLAVVWDRLTGIHERWLGDLQGIARPARPGAAAALERNVTERLVLTRRIEVAFSRHDGTTAYVLLRDLYRLPLRGAALRGDHGFADCGTGTPESIAG